MSLLINPRFRFIVLLPVVTNIGRAFINPHSNKVSYSRMSTRVKPLTSTLIPSFKSIFMTQYK